MATLKMVFGLVVIVSAMVLISESALIESKQSPSSLGTTEGEAPKFGGEIGVASLADLENQSDERDLPIVGDTGSEAVRDKRFLFGFGGRRHHHHHHHHHRHHGYGYREYGGYGGYRPRYRYYHWVG